jgi:hypothetical protein
MGRGYGIAMPWLAKALLLALKTKRGRELLFAAGIALADIARSKRARELYATAWEAAADPRARQKAFGLLPLWERLSPLPQGGRSLLVLREDAGAADLGGDCGVVAA